MIVRNIDAGLSTRLESICLLGGTARKYLRAYVTPTHRERVMNEKIASENDSGRMYRFCWQPVFHLVSRDECIYTRSAIGSRCCDLESVTFMFSLLYAFIEQQVGTGQTYANDRSILVFRIKSYRPGRLA